MERTIDYFLIEWKNREGRKPLLLRGARQVGKTHAVRVLGANFSHFLEINLEENKAARSIIEKDFDIDRILLQLSELLQEKIVPGSTLLFFDEIQNVPQAITALRYFYERVPTLHVIAAGSLLDFALEQVGLPVGRVSTLYMYPLSFLEFLIALGHKTWAKSIIDYTPTSPIQDPLHEKLLDTVGIYLALGGMPGAINEWLKTKQSRDVKRVHSELLFAYEQDFGKYAKRHQVKYLDLLFIRSIEQLSRKFMYARVGEYKKRELEPSLVLLEKAGLIYKVIHSSGQGIPLGAQADLDDFKIIFLDVGLSQALLKLDITTWFINPLMTFVNKGEIVEAFIGQEILAYSDPINKETLFYWSRETRGSEAEVDYLIQIGEQVVPVEVKSGTSKRIKSMQIFLETHLKSSYGIRFWAQLGSLDGKIYSYPLYAVVKPLLDNNSFMRQAIMKLIS